MTVSGAEASLGGGASFFGVEMSGSEEEDNVLWRLSRIGVVCSLESTEDGNGVLGLLVVFFPLPHPSRSAAEVVKDLSIGLSGSLGFRSRRGMADFLGGEAGRGTLKERFLFVTFNFGIVV